MNYLPQKPHPGFNRFIFSKSILIFPLLLLLIIFFPKICPAKIHFIKEKIIIRIQNGELEVNGHYFFWNESGSSDATLLSYPFFGKFPHKINVHTNKDGKYSKVSYRKAYKKNSITFPIYLNPKTELEVKVRYIQKILENQAVYILTSTEKWRENLKEANFDILISKELKGVNISYETDSIEEHGNFVIYRISKKDFMPTKDLIISWEGGENE